ncbi:MAG: deoxycytidine triphosphate deaminase [Alphaproteobacteria bacterium]|nr:deoxycytidine triphosphate deaminase [Alphaproteobacteria bacterium]
MGFWTSQKIERQLRQKCPPNQPCLVALPDADHPSNGKPVDDSWIEAALDCNALTLRVGNEVYISPSESADRAPGKSIIQLNEKESFTIPAGQFAFLTTEEIIKVPDYAMAFISIKATQKFKGLINVSGFHVDPGFHGQLVFAVFNAGPQAITLRRGMNAFLIWFADLVNETEGDATEKPRDKGPQPALGLDPNKLNGIAGEVHSFKGLLARMEEGKKELNERLHAVEREHMVIKWAVTLIVGLLVGILAKKMG